MPSTITHVDIKVEDTKIIMTVDDGRVLGVCFAEDSASAEVQAKELRDAMSKSLSAFTDCLVQKLEKSGQVNLSRDQAYVRGIAYPKQAN